MIYIFTLMVISGVIAYIGDTIGTKIGKRKLTIWKLRPRHTALIVVIATGMIITLFTVAVSSVWSTNVRDALFYMDQIKQGIENLKADKEALQKDKERLDAEKKALDKEVGILDAEKKRLETEKTNLQADVEDLMNKVRIKETEKVVYRKGEPLTHIVIKAGLDSKEVMKELTTFIISLSDIVKRKNIKVSNEINFFSRNKEQLDAMSNMIAEAKQDMVVGAVADENMISGENLGDVRFIILPNTLIFKENQEIASLEIDGNLGRVEIARTLQNFMEALNREVVAIGMIQNPLTGQFGVMSYRSMISFYDMVSRIKSIGKKVKLTAYAAQDTYSIGPLNLMFKFDETGEKLYTTNENEEGTK